MTSSSFSILSVFQMVCTMRKIVTGRLNGAYEKLVFGKRTYSCYQRRMSLYNQKSSTLFKCKRTQNASPCSVSLKAMCFMLALLIKKESNMEHQKARTIWMYSKKDFRCGKKEKPDHYL